MRKTRNISNYKLSRIIIISVVVAFILILHCLHSISQRIDSYAEEDCLNRLRESTLQAANDFENNMNQSMSVFQVFAAVALGNEEISPEQVQVVTDEYRDSNGYSGIEILWRDRTITASGDIPENTPIEVNFQDDLENAPYISDVIKFGDLRSEQYIYQAVPIIRNQEILGIVYGYIPIDVLGDYIDIELYDQKCQILIIDGATGDFMVDDYHRVDSEGREIPLMNMYTMEERKSVGDYSFDDVKKQVAAGESGYWIFESKKTDDAYYSNFVPIGINHWMLMVTIDDTTAYEGYVDLFLSIVKILLYIILIVTVLILVIVLQHRKNRLEYQRMAEGAIRANTAKTEFLSRMSHDIRTPINGIVGMTHIMEAEADNPEKIREGISNINQLSRELEELVNDVLEMSRIESGKTELAHETFSLPATISQNRLAIFSLAKSKEVALLGGHYNITHEYVVGSPLHILRIITNIITNAVKYNRPGGGVECWLNETTIDENHSDYEFIIKDTGIGMSEEFLQHVFEPFSRENEEVKTDYQGTGLGMSIAKELLDKMGGTIDIQSKLGEGTTVVIHIPLEIAEAPVSAEEKENTTTLEGKKVLLVEDNPMNMKIAKYIVEEERAIVSTAQNGKEAVEVFEASDVGTFDLILMDVRMPVMDGYEATRTIRSLVRPDAKTIPIFAVTANAFEEDIDECIAAGMNEHISKPLNIEDMMEKIEKYL